MILNLFKFSITDLRLRMERQRGSPLTQMQKRAFKEVCLHFMIIDADGITALDLGMKSSHSLRRILSSALDGS